MTAAAVVEIVAWGARAVTFIVNLIADAVQKAKEGSAPTLDELDARLAEHQKTGRDEREARRAQDAADAEARARAAAAAAMKDPGTP